ncbi:unnamed protein product [Rotaria sordida]|uniref:G-protein coupled receptors family 1 profile domain-containing protein n=1 Tax=Rotaria sordida TaxID=392033 RepID=A0A815E0E5_9BILA|nr:unnamed protein product [Rotaria sordida]CAF1578840.1 unnamed protein product [Rotaria sordida]
MTSKRVILGFIGNILGLFVFWSSRRTWQVSSAYVYLATSCSITNLLCVIRYVSLLHSRFRNILYELVGQIWWACKVYEFAFSFRVISSWITLFWMFERLMCVSKKLRACFNKCNSYQLKFIIPILLILTILSCVIGPPVYMFEPQILDKEIMVLTTNINRTYCDLSSKASMKWKKYFHEIHIGLNHFTIRCLFSELIPAGAIILFNSYIIYHVVRISRRLHQTNARQPRKEQWRTKLWMNIVLVLHSLLFLSSLLAHIVGHFIPIEAHEAWWVLLAILFNCSLNFYVYCLSGKAFRNEIYLFIQRFKRRFFHRQHIHQHQRQQCRRSWNLS